MIPSEIERALLEKSPAFPDILKLPKKSEVLGTPRGLSYYWGGGCKPLRGRCYTPAA